MERTALLQADYLDIIFDRRNKNYGGYELRKHYPQRVKKAMSAVLIMASLISAYTVFANRDKAITAPIVIPKTIELSEVPDIPQQQKQQVPELPPPPENVATASMSHPEIVVDNQVRPEDQLASVDDLKNKQIGLENHDGDPTITDIGVITDPHTTGTGNTIVESNPPSKEPMKWVEQMPQFNGNLQEYLASSIHYHDMAKEAGIEGRVAVQFVVDEQGNIADAHILKGIGGGCDQEALRVVKSMPRWKPGKNNGVPAKVLFTLPITFTLN